ncbi:response regulator transcription factor [Treponema zioleckii]|uniref:response regulator transcription factor n=1 Tax=Treponema zioleckii TaxID=331680 RepID=UPI00168BFDE0|nr:response regulator transcription factor [Treponema zioleckii]
MADKVLIVDDDDSIRKLLQKVMDINGLESECVSSGSQALEKLKNNAYDIILMDVMLGDMEGFEVIKQIREDGIKTPVMIISGRNEDYDSLYGLSIGADDYVTKPFRPVVLGAKVKALLRRCHDSVAEPQTDGIQLGPFSYNPDSMKFFKNGQELLLSAKESALLLLFLHCPNKVISKEEIHAHVWGESFVIDDNAIMVYINRLRGKIEEDPKNPVYIVTVKGSGYRFVV